VAEMLTYLKSRSHAHAPCLMQNTEAVIFIHSIVERIRLERPNIPIFTIHDSILTTPDNIDYVRDIIMQVFEQLGVRPLLKTEG